MPRRSLRSRDPALTRFQLLWHRVEIEADDDDAASALDYLVTDADHSPPAVADARYAVRRRGDGWLVTEDGLTLSVACSTTEVLDLVYRRLHQRVYELASLRGWVRLHAATVDVASPDGPVRVIIAAPTGTGKTSLACRLRLDGVDAVADESVLVRAGWALPVARRFHVKSGTIRAVPELAELSADAPRLDAHDIRALDPRRLAAAWHIEPRPIGAVILLRRGQRESFEAASAVQAMPELLTDCFPNQEGVDAVVREIAHALRVAACHRLVTPDTTTPASAVASAATALVAGLTCEA